MHQILYIKSPQCIEYDTLGVLKHPTVELTHHWVWLHWTDLLRVKIVDAGILEGCWRLGGWWARLS